MNQSDPITIAVIQYPGTNCEYETASAVEAAGMSAEIFRWNRHPEELIRFDGYVLAGGFSYQDRVRAGAIAAKKQIIGTLIREAAIGKPVLGICNGAQILIESGLVPGNHPGHVEMSLASNAAAGWRGYFCDWVYLRCQEKGASGAFNLDFTPGEIIPMPVAHAEGRFVSIDPALLDRITQSDQIAFRYCDAEGRYQPSFPINPNGSFLNAAGIYNPEGNVLAFMPHPERAAWMRQIPLDLDGSLRTATLEHCRMPGPGLRFFTSMKRFISNRRTGR